MPNRLYRIKCLFLLNLHPIAGIDFAQAESDQDGRRPRPGSEHHAFAQHFARQARVRVFSRRAAVAFHAKCHITGLVENIVRSSRIAYEAQISALSNAFRVSKTDVSDGIRAQCHLE
jgi:hypothetical protein